MKKSTDDEKILFVKTSITLHKGPANNGCLVTDNGNVYDFDIGSHWRTKKDLLLFLTNVLKNNTSTKKINQKVINDAYNLLYFLDEDSEMKTVVHGCDAGQTSLYAYYNDNLIQLATVGDFVGFVDCKEVEEILEILDIENFYTLSRYSCTYTIEDIKKDFSEAFSSKIFS